MSLIFEGLSFPFYELRALTTDSKFKTPDPVEFFCLRGGFQGPSDLGSGFYQEGQHPQEAAGARPFPWASTILSNGPLKPPCTALASMA